MNNDHFYYMYATDNLCFSYSFLAVFMHLSFACIDGVKLKYDLQWCPKRPRKLVVHPNLPFLLIDEKIPVWPVLLSG